MLACDWIDVGMSHSRGARRLKQVLKTSLCIRRSLNQYAVEILVMPFLILRMLRRIMSRHHMEFSLLIASRCHSDVT